MVDVFYDAYAEALDKNGVGKYPRWQKYLGWGLVSAMGLSILTLVLFFKIRMMKGMVYSVVAYVVIAILLHCLLNYFEKTKAAKMKKNALIERRDALKETIEAFLGQGNYDSKIDFLVSLYERAIKQREEREKLFRRIGIAVFTAFGTIIVNALDSPDNTSWRLLMAAIICVAVTAGLALAPFYYKAMFDSKKQDYYYMVVELQSVKFLVHSEIQSPTQNQESKHNQGDSKHDNRKIRKK